MRDVEPMCRIVAQQIIPATLAANFPTVEDVIALRGRCCRKEEKGSDHRTLIKTAKTMKPHSETPEVRLGIDINFSSMAATP
jgi:hypothetical protein